MRGDGIQRLNVQLLNFERGAARMRRVLMFIIAMGLTVRTFAGAAPPGDVPSATTNAPAQPVLDLLVLNRVTHAPISGAALTIDLGPLSAAWIKPPSLHATIAADGHCRIPLPPDENLCLHIEVRADGFVPTLLQFLRVEHERAIPATYTLMMETAVPVGGIVQDEDGHPIEGVTVSFWYVTEGWGPEFPLVSDESLTTDRDGRWRSISMPANFANIWIELRHKGFFMDRDIAERAFHQVEMVRDMSAVFLMRRTLTITGRVLTEKGKPISGARVHEGTDLFPQPDDVTTTGPDGRFSLTELRSKESIITVQAAGYAPELTHFIVKEGMLPIEVRLTFGRTICARLVDQEGRSVAGTLMATHWRGFGTLYWQAFTDALGRICWSNAPTDEVKVAVVGGYPQDFPFSAGKTDFTIPCKR